jgi:hypothetical protein
VLFLFHLLSLLGKAMPRLMQKEKARRGRAFRRKVAVPPIRRLPESAAQHP